MNRRNTRQWTLLAEPQPETSCPWRQLYPEERSLSGDLYQSINVEDLHILPELFL